MDVFEFVIISAFSKGLGDVDSGLARESGQRPSHGGTEEGYMTASHGRAITRIGNPRWMD